MALLFVLLLAVLSLSSGQENRCGSSWSNADTSPCNTKCPDGTNSKCPSGQTCFASCSTSKTCSTSTTGSSTTTTTGSVTGSTTKTITLTDLQKIMNNNGITQAWCDAINLALSRYGLNTILRIIAFLSEVRHETAGMSVFHQGADNGGGLLHMTPSNWKGACLAVPEIKSAFDARYSGCSSSTPCGCVDAMASSPMGSTATDASNNIFSQPKVAALSAGWWWDAGAKAAFGWKGCTQKLSFYADQGKGAAGSSDCSHTGNYQLCCCIFWTINEASGSGLTQRNAYYDATKSYAATAWGYKADTAEEIAQFHGTPAINAGIAIGCVVGIVSMIIVIVAVYLKRKQRIQSEVV